MQQVGPPMLSSLAMTLDSLVVMKQSYLSGNGIHAGSGSLCGQFHSAWASHSMLSSLTVTLVGLGVMQQPCPWNRHPC